MKTEQAELGQSSDAHFDVLKVFRGRRPSFLIIPCWVLPFLPSCSDGDLTKSWKQSIREREVHVSTDGVSTAGGRLRRLAPKLLLFLVSVRTCLVSDRDICGTEHVWHAKEHYDQWLGERSFAQMTGRQQHPQSSTHRQLPLRQVQPIQQPSISLKQEQQELLDHKPNLQKCQLIGQSDGSVNTQRHQRLPVQSNGSMSLHQSQQLDSQGNLNISSLQQQQLLGTYPIVSNIPGMHMLKKIKVEVQHPLHDHQQTMGLIQPQSQHNQHQQSQQHIMTAFQSQSNQLQQELGMGQQPSVQQSLQISTGMFVQQNNIDKQKQYTQAQCGLQEVPFSTTMDITAQTGHPGECYLQDEIYDMIKSLKDQYFTELTDLYNEMFLKLQSHMPPQIPIDHYEEMKKFKLFLERALHFLEIKKESIQPSLWEKIPEYERQIINAISSQRMQPVRKQEQQFHQSSTQITNSNIPQQQQASPGSGDWQESSYQMIKRLKDKHFAELSHLCNKLSMKLEYVDSQM
uniref:Uncharacterized protein n=1 Tax=Oryza glumipatula TaxID=40148 RepID=A0A0E0BKA6_9ORYZ